MTAHGTIQVFASPFNGQTVQDAYPDVTSGTQVTVTDSSGKVIGTGALTYDAGMTTTDERLFASSIPGTSASTYAEWVEAFAFTIKVPAGLSRYGISTGHGVVWFSAKEMRKGPALSLGSMSG